MNVNITIKQSISIATFFTGLLLLVPLIAMNFTDEINWTFSDFVIAGGMLFGSGLSFLLIIRTSTNIWYHAAIGITLCTMLFLVWSNLAVGLIGSEDNSINGLYLIVIFVGIIGAVISKLQAKGMTIVLFIQSLIIFLIAGIAVLIDHSLLGEKSFNLLLGVTLFFSSLFAIAGWLFHYSKRK